MCHCWVWTLRFLEHIKKDGEAHWCSLLLVAYMHVVIVYIYIYIYIYLLGYACIFILFDFSEPLEILISVGIFAVLIITNYLQIKDGKYICRRISYKTLIYNS